MYIFSLKNIFQLLWNGAIVNVTYLLISIGNFPYFSSAYLLFYGLQFFSFFIEAAQICLRCRHQYYKLNGFNFHCLVRYRAIFKKFELQISRRFVNDLKALLHIRVRWKPFLTYGQYLLPEMPEYLVFSVPNNFHTYVSLWWLIGQNSSHQ